MISNLKTIAESWRRLLWEGLITLGEVQASADALILELDKPPLWLITTSMAQDIIEVISALAASPGDADAPAVRLAMLAGLRDLLERRPDQDSEIARRLFFMADDGDVPAPGTEGEMMSFWDAIDLARDGTYGVLEVERAKMREFLERWSRSVAP